MGLFKLLLISAALLGWLIQYRQVQGSARWYLLLLLGGSSTEFIGAWLVDHGRPSNTLYQFYILFEIVLAALFITSTSTERWARRWPLMSFLVYGALLGWEWRNSTGQEILLSKSLLFAWALLVLASCVVLLQRSYMLFCPMWRTWQFWCLLSLLVYFSLSLPTVGLIGQIYAEDPILASDLYGVMDFFFTFRYGSAIIAATLLKSPDRNQQVIEL